MKKLSVKKKYNTQAPKTGGRVLNITYTNGPYTIEAIPKNNFKKSYDSSFFVRRQIAFRRLAIMTAFYKDFGINSPFKNILSKDVTIWFLKKYIIPENQCTVYQNTPKVWVTNNLYDTNNIDVVFSQNTQQPQQQALSIRDCPCFITESLVIHPIIIQTPTFGIQRWNEPTITGVFHQKDTIITEKFKSVIETIDNRAKEWLFQNLKTRYPFSEYRIVFAHTNEHEYYMDFDIVNKIYSTNSLFKYVSINGVDRVGLDLTYDSKVLLFNKDGSSNTETVSGFLTNTKPKGSMKFVKCIVEFKCIRYYRGYVIPIWQVIQILEVEPPTVSIDYGFMSDDENE